MAPATVQFRALRLRFYRVGEAFQEAASRTGLTAGRERVNALLFIVLAFAEVLEFVQAGGRILAAALLLLLLAVDFLLLFLLGDTQVGSGGGCRQRRTTEGEQ
jgi:hypothetical protein